MNETISASGKGSGSMVRVGGGLGIAASIIGMAIFLTACGGYEGSLKLSFLPLVLGLPGVILSVLGGIFQENPDDTHVMGALFPSALGVIGGIVMMAAWLQWPIFAK
jgi:hypothetical protein